MAMSKPLRRIWSVFTTIIVAFVVIMALLLVGCRVFGLQSFTILSGSMEPTYPTGSLIYVESVKPSEIEVGDPITYVLDESLTVVTHRVVEIDSEEQNFYTKGDAVENADPAPVYFENLIGRPVFCIPYLGYVANFIQNPPGMYICIVCAVVLLALLLVPDIVQGIRNRKKGDDSPAAPADQQ